MLTKRTTDRDVVIYELSGRIQGGEQIEHFHNSVRNDVETGKRNFVLDLADVEWSNSLGLGSLVAAQASIARAHGRMVLANTGNIQKLLTMTRLTDVFTIHPDRPTAIKFFTD